MDYGGIDWGIKNAFKEIKFLLLSLSGSVSLLDPKYVFSALFKLFKCLQDLVSQIEKPTLKRIKLNSLDFKILILLTNLE